MKKPLLIFAVLFCSNWLGSQSLDGFSVEINKNREGYDFIETMLQGKKIVLLGELDHGDGSSFSIKTELIKYLHEELGYNTLVFEASIINCDFLWNAISDSARFKNQIKNSIYNIWSEVEETKELFNYIEEQYRRGVPLKIVGIDPQFSGIENTHEFNLLLKTTLPPHIVASKSFSEFMYEIEIMSTWMVFPKEKQHKLSEEEFVNYCDTIFEAISNMEGSKINLSLWKMYLDNVKIMGKIKRKRDKLSFEMRDEQMYKNVNYWIKENPNEKIIIWAANAHIVRKDNVLKKQGNDFYLLGLKKLGDYLYENYPDLLYAVAFTSGQGATLDISNPDKTNIINTPKRNSLEGLMSGRKICFVDLNLFENNLGLGQYDSQLFYTNTICAAKWSQHFDGFIYIPEMRPSTPLWQSNKK